MRTTNILELALQYLKGVGPRRAADLKRAGLLTVEDLLYRFPMRYEDRGHLQTIAELRAGEMASIAGEILNCGVRTTRRPGFKIFEMLVSDATGVIRATWFNQPYLRDVLQPHQRVFLFGKVEARGRGVQLTNPQYEIQVHREGEADDDEEDTIHTGRIVPIYERTGSVSPKLQRRIVHAALRRLPADLPDIIPREVRERLALPAARDALAQVHFPDAGTSVTVLNQFRAVAQVRMIFEEFFLFQLGLILRRRQLDAERKPIVLRVDDRIRRSALAVLPFRLTDGQKAAHCRKSLPTCNVRDPMNRLLQGDVGAGKTIVATAGRVWWPWRTGCRWRSWRQRRSLRISICSTCGACWSPHGFEWSACRARCRPSRRRGVMGEVASGDAHLVVGTHALVQDRVAFHALGLVIIDEQHRFGVLQRATLRSKGLRAGCTRHDGHTDSEDTGADDLRRPGCLDDQGVAARPTTRPDGCQAGIPPRRDVSIRHAAAGRGASSLHRVPAGGGIVERSI